MSNDFKPIRNFRTPTENPPVIGSEEWRDVPGYKGRYKVSSIGRLIGYGRYNGKIVSAHLRNGYFGYPLRNNYMQKNFKIHRLVAMAFIPNPENKPHVNHKNGIKTDNRVENLEWVTAAENLKHAIDTGLRTPPHGEAHCRAKLTEIDVLYIRSEYNREINTYEEWGNKFGVNEITIRKVVQGKSWSRLLKDNKHFIVTYSEYISSLNRRMFDDIEVAAQTPEQAYAVARRILETREKEGIVLGSIFVKGQRQDVSLFDQVAGLCRPAQ